MRTHARALNIGIIIRGHPNRNEVLYLCNKCRLLLLRICAETFRSDVILITDRRVVFLFTNYITCTLSGYWHQKRKKSADTVIADGLYIRSHVAKRRIYEQK